MIFSLVGLAIGFIGSLIGAGGGFLLIPLLIYFLPGSEPSRITAISLLAVSVNAVSGSIVYMYRKKVQWRSAICFSIASLPGIFLGIYLNNLVDRDLFIITFGLLIISLSIYIMKKTLHKTIEVSYPPNNFFLDNRKIILGSSLSTIVGTIASFLGIGGGIIHVPLLHSFLGYPLHLAIGTSHFILALSSLFAVQEHWKAGIYGNLETFILYLLGGIFIGAQLGSQVSKNVSSTKILRVLSIALFLGGIRLLFC